MTEQTEKNGNPVRIPYFARWGRHRTKTKNGSWKKDRRRERALAREAAKAKATA